MCGCQGHLEGPLWSCLSPSLLTGGAENVHFLGKRWLFLDMPPPAALQSVQEKRGFGPGSKRNTQTKTFFLLDRP